MFSSYQSSRASSPSKSEQRAPIFDQDELMKPLQNLQEQGFNNSWTTLEEAFDGVRSICMQIGFNIRKGRTVKRPGTQQQRYWQIECSFAGKNKPKTSYKRIRISHACGCKWTASLSTNNKTSKIHFLLSQQNEYHNHPLDASLAGHHSAGRRAKITPDITKYIAEHGMRNTTTSTSIATSLRTFHPELFLRWTDVRNIRSRIRGNELGGRTETQGFLEKLRTTEGIFTAIHRGKSYGSDVKSPENILVIPSHDFEAQRTSPSTSF